MIEPDWDELQKVADTASKLAPLTDAQYTLLFRRAKTACKGNEQFMEFLLKYAPSGVAESN